MHWRQISQSITRKILHSFHFKIYGCQKNRTVIVIVLRELSFFMVFFVCFFFVPAPLQLGVCLLRSENLANTPPPNQCPPPSSLLKLVRFYSRLLSTSRTHSNSFVASVSRVVTMTNHRAKSRGDEKFVDPSKGGQLPSIVRSVINMFDRHISHTNCQSWKRWEWLPEVKPFQHTKIAPQSRRTLHDSASEPKFRLQLRFMHKNYFN